MTTEQTAQQLELAAQIIRTGHPWKSSPQAPDTDIYSALRDGFEIRPILVTFPDGRPFHNPDNLTAEQVGAGFRLTLKDESAHKDAELWNNYDKKWVDRLASDVGSEYGKNNTYRLPFSVPWPEPQPDPYAELKKAHAEGKVIQWHTGTSWIDHILPDNWEPIWIHPVKDYRIKPDAPPFQLPPPPPGMQWHSTDGWQEGDLPQGWRPLVLDEISPPTDEIKRHYGWTTLNSPGDCPELPAKEYTAHCRTRRPLTFTHAGKTWTYHRPDGPMPCKATQTIYYLDTKKNAYGPELPSDLFEKFGATYPWPIIGWRYADQKKTVPLGPEDVMPGSVIQGVSSPSWHWIAVVSVHQVQIKLAGHCGDIGTDKPTWEELKLAAKINRSLPLTGKWNPAAWEPCHKTI